MEPNLDWYEENSKKLSELNEFLQLRGTGKVGDHVIDVAMQLITELEKKNTNLNKEIGMYSNKLHFYTQAAESLASELRGLTKNMVVPKHF